MYLTSMNYTRVNVLPMAYVQTGLPDYTEEDWDNAEAFRNLTPEGLLSVSTRAHSTPAYLTMRGSGPTLQLASASAQSQGWSTHTTIRATGCWRC